MTLSIQKANFAEYSLVKTALDTNDINLRVLEAATRLSSLVHQTVAMLHSNINICRIHSAINKLCSRLALRITEVALQHGLFVLPKKLAVISGAGISGLTAALTLRTKDFNVAVVEERSVFSRYNVINFNLEVEAFLKQHGLLSDFQQQCAARIEKHHYLLIKPDGSIECINIEDVSQLKLDESLSFTPETVSQLFKHDGVYSASIQRVQTFLTKHALKAGVNVFGSTTANISHSEDEEQRLTLKIAEKQPMQPNLFFIAEGVHSKTAPQLGMQSNEVPTSLPKHWIFGNLSYPGKTSFVICIIDTSQASLQLTNMIFNSMEGVLNVAMTSGQHMTQEAIHAQILQTVKRVFEQKAVPLEPMECTLLATVPQPIHTVDHKRFPYSSRESFSIGDTAGNSSPLAGLGGTLGLTLVPQMVEKAVDDYENKPSVLHANFEAFSKASTGRWLEKAQTVHQFCLKLFENAHATS